jgi:hypothetical protein
MSRFNALASAFLLFAATGAMAATPGDYTHEITGGTSGRLSFGGGDTRIGLGLGYHYFLLPDMGIQVGYTTDLNYADVGGTKTTAWDNVFGGRYNLSMSAADVPNQAFIDAGLGFALRDSGADSATKFLADVGVGKRFALGSNVTYSPNVSLRKVEDENLQVNIVPLAFSIFLG